MNFFRIVVARKPGETDDIGEQHRDLTAFALFLAGARSRLLWVRRQDPLQADAIAH